MKIAVIGVYYSENLGDGVICDCVAYWLKQAFPEADIHIIDIEGKTDFLLQQSVTIKLLQYRHYKLKWDEFLTKTGIKDRIYYWNKLDVDTRRDFYEKIGKGNFDAAVFAGGQLFMDWLSLDICEFLKQFEKRNVPVYFNACGVGFAISENIRRQLNKYLIKNNVRLISSRDDAEMVEARYLCKKRKTYRTFDPALWCKEVYGEIKKSRDLLGLGIMYSNHTSFKKLTRFWISLIKELEKRHIKWKMFCNGSAEDYSYGWYVLKKAGLKGEQYILPYPKRPKELVKQITSFSKIISFRLHSHIIAAAYDIPAVAIVWDDKLRFFYRKIHHEERCRSERDSPDVILDTLDTAVKEGYDRAVIEKQKDFSRKLLIDAITTEDLNEQRKRTC